MRDLRGDVCPAPEGAPAHNVRRAPERAPLATEAALTAAVTHEGLCRLAARWLRRRGCSVVLVEPQTLRTGEFPDAIGWRGLTSWLVECKVSRADFRRDQKKLHRQPGAGGMGAVRWYLTPPGLLTPAEVPPGWGLLEARGTRVFVVKRVGLLPNGWPEAEAPPETLRSEMALLLAQLERVAKDRPTHVQPAKEPLSGKALLRALDDLPPGTLDLNDLETE